MSPDLKSHYSNIAFDLDIMPTVVLSSKFFSYTKNEEGTEKKVRKNRRQAKKAESTPNVAFDLVIIHEK